MIKLDSNIKSIQSNFARLTKKGLKSIMIDGVNKVSSFFGTILADKHLTGGPSGSSLGVRSGRLRQSITPLPLSTEGQNVEGGISIGKGVAYATTHISDTPKVTVIVPKTAQYLAIPLTGSPTMTAAGVANYTGSIRSAFPFLKPVGGVLADTEGDSFVPYFALKKSVTIKSRVHIDEIVRTNQGKIDKIFIKTVDSAVTKYIKG